jgi:hypothetical protein|uniref:Uncharacterized protein n=1 Tax=Picea glauca TaxID=3330 RepID=A0A117NIJ0_PICGL|nr:hypothetical protein ABT39_MTgene3228 [Picea glauca]QHR89274.1 hypothetical protein Q903MT_gene3295 [Picea sitchensis]
MLPLLLILEPGKQGHLYMNLLDQQGQMPMPTSMPSLLMAVNLKYLYLNNIDMDMVRYGISWLSIQSMVRRALFSFIYLISGVQRKQWVSDFRSGMIDYPGVTFSWCVGCVTLSIGRSHTC